MSFKKNSYTGYRINNNSGAGQDKPSSMVFVRTSDTDEVMSVVSAYNSRNGRMATVTVIRKDESKAATHDYWIEVKRITNVTASEAMGIAKSALNDYVNGGGEDEI